MGSDLNDQSGYDSERAWNSAPTEIIRGLHQAIVGYDQLVGSAFGVRMGQTVGGQVVVLFAPPWMQHPDDVRYIYPTDSVVPQVEVGSRALTRLTTIAVVVNDKTMQMTGSFAHEFTHILAQKVLPTCDGIDVESDYCYNVGGYVYSGRWHTFSRDESGGRICPPGREAWALPEAVANTVGLYIATGGSASVHGMPPVAFNWVQGYYRTQVASPGKP